MQGHGGAEIALPEQPPETIAPPARDPTTKGCCRKNSSPSSRMLEEQGAGVAPSRSSPRGVQEGAATPHCTCPNPKKTTASPGGAAAEPTPPPLPLVQGTEEHQPTPATPTSTLPGHLFAPLPKKKKAPQDHEAHEDAPHLARQRFPHLHRGPELFGSLASGWAGLLIFWSPELGVTPTCVFIFRFRCLHRSNYRLITFYLASVSPPPPSPPPSAKGKRETNGLLIGCSSRPGSYLGT